MGVSEVFVGGAEFPLAALGDFDSSMLILIYLFILLNQLQQQFLTLTSV